MKKKPKKRSTYRTQHREEVSTKHEKKQSNPPWRVFFNRHPDEKEKKHRNHGS